METKDKAFSSTPPGAFRSNLAGHGAAASEQRAASIPDRDTIERVGKNPVASVDRYRVALLAVIGYFSVASRLSSPSRSSSGAVHDRGIVARASDDATDARTMLGISVLKFSLDE